jgi:spermidine synthase
MADIELMNCIAGGQVVESACTADSTTLYKIDFAYWAGKSRYCDIVIAQSPVYGKVLFLDNEIQSAESDEAIYHEHLIHPVFNAMAMQPNKRVLIVGGGEGATAREVLKWPSASVGHVDWVDIDGDLVDLCRRHLSWANDTVYNDPRLHYFSTDIRNFWASNSAKYDIIILDLPDPDVDMLGGDEDLHDYPLYGKQFWRSLRAHLTDDGAVVSHCGPVAPGGNSKDHRAGLDWIQNMSLTCGLGNGFPYHTCIPSFQGQWGFWMSKSPQSDNNFPNGLVVMDNDAQNAAFHWPKFWNSTDFGCV